MVRKIIHIDEEKCNGCGLCAKACHESAIAIFHGKAKLIKDDYCDGLGDCLPTCPTGAISFVEREAAPYDEVAVKAHVSAQQVLAAESELLACGCPGSVAKALQPDRSASREQEAVAPAVRSHLMQWPVQIKLAPLWAPYFDNAHLLIAADCTAYAYGNFHNDFIRGKVTLVGCPKLDSVDYSQKLTEIIRGNNIKSVTVVRMEVPCCGGIVDAVKKALMDSGKFIPWQIVTISTDGQILD